MGNSFFFRNHLITNYLIIRMVIDYQNLNDQMVKNNYPLPLITDLIDNIGGK